MTPAAKSPYAGYRFPGEITSYAVWLYFRFPLSLRNVDEILAARGIVVRHETVRQWARKFGQGFANQIRRRLPRAGDKWPLDEVEVKIAGKKHWLWRVACPGRGAPGGPGQRRGGSRGGHGALSKPRKIHERARRGVGAGKTAREA